MKTTLSVDHISLNDLAHSFNQGIYGVSELRMLIQLIYCIYLLLIEIFVYNVNGINPHNCSFGNRTMNLQLPFTL